MNLTNQSTDQEVIQRAREEWAHEDLGIDENAVVSRGDEWGAFVQAWVWVPFDEVIEDEE